MLQFPISFFAEAESSAGIHSHWKVKSQNISNACAVPPEFDGPGGALSPEDLFAQALTNCFVGTFKVYAEKSHLSYENLSVRTELFADLDESKKPVMKKCKLEVFISGCEKPDRIKTLAEKAFRTGFILNSVKTELVMDLQVA